MLQLNILDQDLQHRGCKAAADDRAASCSGDAPCCYSMPPWFHRALTEVSLKKKSAAKLVVGENQPGHGGAKRVYLLTPSWSARYQMGARTLYVL